MGYSCLVCNQGIPLGQGYSLDRTGIIVPLDMTRYTPILLYPDSELSMTLYLE